MNAGSVQRTMRHEGVSSPASLAQIEHRIWARFVGAGIATGLGIAATLAAVAVAVLVGPDFAGAPLQSGLGVAVAIAEVYLVGRYGWDLGKLATGLRVVDYHNRAPGLGKSLLRSAVLWGPLLAMWGVGSALSPPYSGALLVAGLLWVPYVLISAHRHPRKQGPHDRIAGTGVVVVDRESGERVTQ